TPASRSARSASPISRRGAASLGIAAERTARGSVFPNMPYFPGPAGECPTCVRVLPAPFLSLTARFARGTTPARRLRLPLALNWTPAPNGVFAMPSFDVVREFDLQESRNAVDQENREVETALAYTAS